MYLNRWLVDLLQMAAAVGHERMLVELFAR